MNLPCTPGENAAGGRACYIMRRDDVQNADVENSFEMLQLRTLRGVDDSERAEDPRNTEKDQHRTRATQTRPVTALLCRWQTQHSLDTTDIPL